MHKWNSYGPSLIQDLVKQLKMDYKFLQLNSRQEIDQFINRIMTKESYGEVFLKRLKELMQENNLNQSTLSVQTNIPRGMIVSWHQGIKNPSLDAMAALAIRFKCSIDYLIGLEDEFGNKVYAT